MTFLNPWLLFGLAAAGAPVAIHLFNRFRPKREEWAAMALLNEALQSRSRQVQIEDILLLLLRTLALILLALAFARPTLPVSSGSALGLNARPAMVVAIDSSYSMRHKTGANTRFEMAKQRAATILSSLDHGDPFTLLLLDDRPHVVARNVGYRPEEVKRLLGKIEPGGGGLNLDRGLETTSELIQELKSPARELYLISDGQSVSWQHLSEKSSRILERIASRASVFFASVGTLDHKNLAITSFAYRSGSVLPGRTARYGVEVTNYGAQPARNVRLHLDVGDTTIDQRTLPVIKPGETAAQPLFAKFSNPGITNLTVWTPEDALPLDNSRFAVTQVPKNINVLLIDAEGETSQRSTDFIKLALQPRPQQSSDSPVKIEQRTFIEFPSSSELDRFDIVILSNVPDIAATQARELHDFVQRGGGLMVFLGDKISPKLTNMRLHDGTTPILPARLTELSEDPKEGSSGWPVRLVGEHPLLRGLHTLPQSLRRNAKVNRYFRSKPDEGVAVLMETGEKDAPLLLEKKIGNGHVLLMTTSAGRQWTNLPLNPMYVLLLQNMVRHLTRAPFENAAIVGRKLRMTLPKQQSATEVVSFHTPADKTREVQVNQQGDQRVAELPNPAAPGFYSVREAGREMGRLAVNIPSGESNVQSLSTSSLRQVLGPLAIQVIGSDQEMGSAIRETRTGFELWPLLLALALVVFGLESFLAQRFSNRAATRSEATPSPFTGFKGT